MPSGFAKPITIKKAIDCIDDGTYLLPAIQRKFVWGRDKIEVLFDSIMRGYPINSFMFWEVKESRIKNSFKFYRFLTDYRQFFKEDNPVIDTSGHRDFSAVIDGQQRLTSIYLGLKGSYAYKLPRKQLKNTEEAIPTRHLYLDLLNRLPEDNERAMIYDFQLLTQAESESRLADPNSAWYCVNNILKCCDRNEVDDYIDDDIERRGWNRRDPISKTVKTTILRLYDLIFTEHLINFYLEETQEIDTVLDIFIRTNSGGMSLGFSDLLMSITTANWQSDARKEMSDLVDRVFQIGNSDFLISKDFVLKTCLFLFNDNIKFQVKNFDQTRVREFEDNWVKIKKSIIESFTFLSNLGFNNHTLRAKNAAIPIIYYIYHKGIENDINSPIRHEKDKGLIRQWICISLLKGVFGSQSDTVLSGLRKVIKEELTNKSKQQSSFPFAAIKEEFRSSPAKNLSFDDEFIDVLLTTQYDSSDCFSVLSLIYYHLNFGNQVYHIDHMHPSSYFKLRATEHSQPEKIKREIFQTDEDFAFASDPLNWNGIANLQLLNDIENMAKQDKPLEDWVIARPIDKSNQLIPNGSLKISDFKTFIEQRKKLLKEQLKKMVT